LVSMGIYVLNAASVRRFVQPETYLDMPDLLRNMQRNGADVRCFRSDCFWLDIGRPDDFAQAQEIYQRDPHIFLGSPA
jgi:NDP-mannose synthase